jgi:hypothetical protein
MQRTNDNPPVPPQVLVADLPIGKGFIYSGSLYVKRVSDRIMTWDSGDDNPISNFTGVMVDSLDLNLHYKTSV